MAGTLVIDTLKSSTTGAPVFQNTIGVETGQLCKAWVNFDGTITSGENRRASFNVSSVTRNSTGDYTVNFTTAMADANYAAIGTGVNNGAYTLVLLPSTYLATSCRFILRINGQNVIEQADRGVVNVAIFR